jgi:hypothetical protein
MGPAHLPNNIYLELPALALDSGSDVEFDPGTPTAHVSLFPKWADDMSSNPAAPATLDAAATAADAAAAAAPPPPLPAAAELVVEHKHQDMQDHAINIDNEATPDMSKESAVDTEQDHLWELSVDEAAFSHKQYVAHTANAGQALSPEHPDICHLYDQPGPFALALSTPPVADLAQPPPAEKEHCVSLAGLLEGDTAAGDVQHAAVLSADQSKQSRLPLHDPLVPPHPPLARASAGLEEPPLVPVVTITPAPADTTAAVIREELQQLKLLRPQLPSQLLRLLLLQMFFYASAADSKVLQHQQSAVHLQVHERHGAAAAAAVPDSSSSYSRLVVEQDLVAMQMQVLKVKLLQYQQRQQGYRTAAAGPQSNWLQVICLILRVLQVQAAVSVWQHVATAADGEESSTRDAIVPTNAIWAAACCLLCYWLCSAVVPTALMPLAVLVVALWLGWSVVAADVASSNASEPHTDIRGSAGFEQSHLASETHHMSNHQESADQHQDSLDSPAKAALLPDEPCRQPSPAVVSTFNTYSSLQQLPPDIMCDVRPCLLSSSMEHTAWPVTWHQTPRAREEGSSGSSSHQQQQLLLHTLPEHNYDTWLHSQAKQKGRDRGFAAETSADKPAAATFDVKEHPVLSGKVTLQRRPKDDFVVRLQELMQSQQGWQRQQHAQYAQVLWMCYEPPMLLEALQAPANSLSGWLLSQQQQRQQRSTGTDSSTMQTSWSPPFHSKQWVQVLQWLVDIAAALANLHTHQLVHGGVQAASVFLTSSGANEDAASTEDPNNTQRSGKSGIFHEDPSCPGHQKRQEICACLSLASPWQHAVTPGRVADLALAAPEVIQLGAHPTSSTAIDIYGFGMLMWQVATGWVPYSQRQGHQQQQDAAGTQTSSPIVDSFQAEAEMYDEMTWCEEMMQQYGTTFPGALSNSWSAAKPGSESGAASHLQANMSAAAAAAAVSSGSMTPQILSDAAFAARHGLLPESAQVEQWLPPGFRELLLDCCQPSPGRRPAGMQQVQQRLQTMWAQCNHWQQLIIGRGLH